jgi:ribulose-5-phosphate 4-epimerase/fuculose-1-phosphate aldolase
LEEISQAGGGNISIKLNDEFSIIKSSGVSLCNVSLTYGHTIIDHKKVKESLLFQEEPLLESMSIVGPKPSLETYFHSFLKKYVVHVHPTVMLPHLCEKHSCCIPYQKPGFELSKTIYRQYKGESIIHLQNHGVIFTSDTLEDIFRIAHLEYELFRPAHFISLRDFWNIQEEYQGFYIYKLSNVERDVYLPIVKRWNIRKLTPDMALFLQDSVFVENNHIFIKANTKSKCLSILEIFRSYCESTDHCKHALSELEIADILHMPSERYRLVHKAST